MKRFISLCLFLLLLAQSTALADSPTGFMYAVSDEYIWKYAREQIEIMTMDGEEVSGFNCGLIEHLAVIQDRLLVSRYDGQSHEIVEYDHLGQLIGRWVFQKEFSVLQIEAVDDQVFLLGSETYADAHNAQGEIYILNRQTGEILPWGPAIGNEYSYFIAASGKLLALNTYRGDLTVFDLTLNTYTELTLGTNFDYFWPDEAGGGCVGYGVRGASVQLMWMDLSTGSLTLLKDLGNDTFAGMRGNARGIYIEDYTKDELLFFSWADLQGPSNATEALVLVNAFDIENGRMSRAIDLFHEKYPNIDVTFRNSNNDVQLAADMMAGNSNVDIVFVQERGGMNAKVMFQSGALVDLSLNAQVMDGLSHWYDVSGLISEGNAVYGVPALVWPYVWYVNTKLLDKLGWEIPEKGWTWEDFFSLGKKLAHYNQDEGTNYKLLSDTDFSYMLRQYNYNEIDIENHHADFDNDIYRNLISQEIEMVHLDVLETKDLFDASEPPENSVFSVQFSSYADLCMPDVTLVYPPVYKKETRYPVFSITGVLNENSPHKEAAEYFLSCYVSPEAVSAEPVLNAGRFLKDETDYPANTLDLTPPNLAYWIDMLTNGVPEFWYGDIERSQQMELYPELIAGHIDIDQYIRILQQKADMSLGE